MKRKFVFFIILLFSSSLLAQEINLEALIYKAEKSIINYSEVFKNLSAEELKTKNFYLSDGKLRERRVIKSLFIVYQSPANKTTDEFRNVIEYNGKNVAKSDGQLSKFFEKLEKASSDKKVKDSLRMESIRFDGGQYSWGITLGQFSPFFRYLPFFEYKINGEEIVADRHGIIIEYNQIKPTNLIQVNPTEEEQKSGNGWISVLEISKNLRPTNPLMSGRIILDKETGQILKNEFKVSINPVSLTKPVIAIECYYEYQPSKFGIFVPKKFSSISYRVTGKNDQDLEVSKSLDSIFEYSNFNQTDSEIKNMRWGTNRVLVTLESDLRMEKKTK